MLIAKITQLDPNPQDKKYSQSYVETGTADAGSIIGSRVRQKIGDKASQLRARSNGRIPAILILYNNTPVQSYADPTHIRAAMYGFETYIFQVPKDATQPISLTDRKFGRGQKLNRQDNTSISAGGIIENSQNAIKLNIYHNIYASHPISQIWFATYLIEQFTLESYSQGEFQDWVLIKTNNEWNHEG